MAFDVTITDVLLASRRIAGRVRRTPLEHSPALSRLSGAEVWLKLENQQLTGSFKLRGAMNRMLAMGGDERARGVITCSSGNHAQAMAMAARTLHTRTVICVPGQCPQVKRDAILERGGEWVELRVIGTFYDEAEEECLRMAEREGLVFVSAFDDPIVAAGQGTAGLEMLLDEPELDAILCPISGAGLIRGVGVAALALRPGIKVWGAHAEANPAWPKALARGGVEPVVEEVSIADALGGGACQSHFDFVKNELAGVVSVTEGEIAEGMRFLFENHRQAAEGGGAVALAALLAGKLKSSLKQGSKIGVVISGGNIGRETFAKILTRD